jgi:hypothetical protein
MGAEKMKEERWTFIYPVIVVVLVLIIEGVVLW